jgi:hypothetical protein
MNSIFESDILAIGQKICKCNNWQPGEEITIFEGTMTVKKCANCKGINPKMH